MASLLSSRPSTGVMSRQSARVASSSPTGASLPLTWVSWARLTARPGREMKRVHMNPDGSRTLTHVIIRTINMMIMHHPTRNIRRPVPDRVHGCWVIKWLQLMRKYKKDHHNPYRMSYGWRISKAGFHMVDNFARENIMKILVMRHQGHSLNHIKQTLEEMNLPGPRSNSWYCATIGKIISENSSALPQHKQQPPH